MVGVSGPGKSTLGRSLAARLAVPYTELDAIHHQPDWAPLPGDEFRDRVTAIAAGDGWVIDGNYSGVLPLVWERADTVIWLDPPRRTVMRRLLESIRQPCRADVPNRAGSRRLFRYL
jgi:adenylate kinase family enzyme